MVSDRGDSEAGDERFTPPSPYDEPTGAFTRPEISEADRDAFYERHRRRPADLSRVESLDDLDPGEVETRQLSVPPTPRRRNPAPATPTPDPVAPTASRDDAAATAAIPSVEETFPELARSKPAAAKSADAAPAATAKLPEESADPVPASVGDATPIPADEPEYHPTVALSSDAYDSDDEADLDDRYGTTDSASHAPARAYETSAYDSSTDDQGRREPETVGAPEARRGTLDAGLLLLRVAVGAVAVAHGLQKLFGLWGGPGLSGYEDMLANSVNPAIGFQANLVTPLAIVGAISETLGGAMLVLGLFTPIAGSAVLAVMLLASAYRMTVAGTFSFFAAGGGIEYELVLAVAAGALILTGPGLYSLDYSRGWARRPFLGSAFWFALGIAAAVAVWVLCNGTNPFASPGNPA